MKEKEIAFKRREKINLKEKPLKSPFLAQRKNRQKEQSGGEAVNLQGSE